MCSERILALSACILSFVCILPAEGKLYGICVNRRSNSSSILDETVVSTSLSCARLCDENEKCKSANYNKLKSTCELFCDNHSNLTSDVCGSLEINENIEFLYEDSPCHFYMPFVHGACQSAEGYQGTFCEEPPRDCDSHADLGDRHIYIRPDICYGLIARCYYDWMFIFRSVNGTFNEKANASWQTFREGFGSADKPEYEYWMGNENLHRLTTQYTYQMQLRVTGVTSGDVTNHYYNFYIDDEDQYYAVHYSTWLNDSPADNQLSDGRPFRTYDHNDDGCVLVYGAAFWYQAGCPFPSPLTGVYSYNSITERMTHFWALIHREL